MEGASSPEASKGKAFSVAALLVVVGVVDLIAYVSGIREAPKYSPWTTATLLNMVFGAAFAVCYLVIRNGPAVLLIPSRVFAFVWILVANFVLLWYVAYMMVLEKDVELALLPHSDGRLRTLVATRTEHDRKKSRLVVVFAVLVAAALLCVGVRAAVKESPADEWKALTSDKWVRLMYADCLSGQLFVALYIATRERSAPLTAALWVAGVLLLGNALTYAYVATMALQALRHDAPFSHVMLSGVASLRAPS